MTTETAAAAGGENSLVRNWLAVALLTLIGVLNYIDRFLPAVLAEPIKRDLALSDTALGIINGFGFLAVYAVVGIPIARIADKGNYSVVIGTCVALWSCMTALGGLALAGWQLALTRMGVAVGEAGNMPASHAYISRNFPPHGRAAPLAVLTLSIPVSISGSLVIGGFMGEIFGWRTTFLIMGVIGLALVPLVPLALGGRRTQALPKTQPESSWQDIGLLFRQRTFVIIMLASSCLSIAGYSLTTFAPAFLMRVHGLNLGDVGFYYGLTVGATGIAGLLITGALADRLSLRDPRWVLWVMVGMIALLLPAAALAFLVPSPWVAIVLIALTNVIANAYMAPVVSAIQRVTPVQLRATASAILLFFCAMAGGLGPLLTGMVSDLLQAELGAKALARALLIVPIGHGLAALFYGLASVTLPRDSVAEDG